ncbi:PREDICTED: ankyrin repeat, SAM and basic leucine zipper domain-containing protein 1 [Dinoponera quadriceps]|uniref:Ankyrin repeat, SAM and basic leucine zipper domain-containing protein 1 n=1 Tax=Dinoponera quadriceps TaxID=609295 RepID=A0A6P3XF56_DINQU|nr:PREDICTED: ankyrin repeat, SAM and basic leucine zipper domain-containing protein 1 [Dinoponera quadriceps]
MNLRPAGMSDDEDDEDDFYFSDTSVKSHSYPSKADFLEKEVYDYNHMQDDERRIFESRVMNACIKGQLDVIEEYLEKYDINQFIHTGWSLLLYATSSVQLEVIEYLLAHGANPNMHKDGFTPLMALCSSTKKLPEISLKCLTLLIEAKADVNATSKMRETPLMYACKSQNVEFVAELLKHVKHINACDSDGRTALSYAVICNKIDIVVILLEHNADTTVIDTYNLTVKDIADAKDFTEISALLTNEKEEKKVYCELSQIITWKDLFPELYPRNKELLDHNISIILYGMDLERYNILFRGMSLKTFLQLTEDDLCQLGIDITVYREQFLENLHKFHCKKWRADSVGIVKKNVPYTIYDAAMSLANIKLQIGVITSSFQYVKNLMKDVSLDPAERAKYEEEIRKTQDTLKILKNEIIGYRKLTREIDRKNSIGLPAIFLTSPEKRKNRTSWVLPLSVTLIIGLYIYKKIYIHRL